MKIYGITSDGNVIISGSLLVSGSITGSNGIVNQLTASNAVSSSNAQTASFTVTAATASYVLNAVSASFVTNAATASYVNPLRQDVIITGSLTVSGSSRVIGTLNADGVQFIKQYNTNGNWFGGSLSVGKQSSANATLDVNGNTIITGSLTVKGTGVVGAVLDTDTTSDFQSTRLFFKMSGSGNDVSIRNLSGSLLVATQATAGGSSGTTTAMFISSSGNVAIGNTQPTLGNLQVLGNVYATSFTGSLLGTASFAASASNATTSSFAVTASHATSVSPLVQNVIVTGSLTITSDLIVQGSASVQYITSSQLNIADNIISVNTITPSIRFGGLSVIDSGSSPQQSGSLLFDSQNNQWIFIHQSPASAAVTSSVLVMGPQTFNNVGNETGLTINRIPKSAGVDLGEHIIDSNITDTGTSVSINSNTQVTGSLTVTAGVTGSLFGTSSWANNTQTASFVITAQTASFVTTAQTASFVTLAQTASFVTLAQTASLALRASGSLTGSLLGTATTASFVTLAQTASFIAWANVSESVTDTFLGTASFVTTAATASFVTLAQTASLALRASGSLTGSLLGTASTASFVTLAQTASYILNAVSASFVSTASYVLNAVSASFVTSAATASFVTTAQTASFVTSSNVFGPNGANSILSASRATSASRADSALSSSFATTASFVNVISTVNATNYSLVGVDSSNGTLIPEQLYTPGPTFNPDTNIFSVGGGTVTAGAFVPNNPALVAFAGTASWAVSASQALTASYYAGTTADLGTSPIIVKAATTVNLSAVYSNGTAGVGAFLSASVVGVLPTIDGITLTTLDSVLVKDQTTQLQNGVYDVVSTGSGATKWIISRSLAANETSEFDPQIVIPAQGTTQAGLIYAQTTTNPVIGTNNIVYTPTTTNQNVTQVTTGTQALYNIPWWTGTAKQLSKGTSNLQFNSTTNQLALTGSMLVSQTITGSILLVSGSNTTSLVTIKQTGTGNALIIEDTAGDTSPFVVDTNGSVAIGKTTVTSGLKLDVSGSVTIEKNDNSGNSVFNVNNFWDYSTAGVAQRFMTFVSRISGSTTYVSRKITNGSIDQDNSIFNNYVGDALFEKNTPTGGANPSLVRTKGWKWISFNSSTYNPLMTLMASGSLMGNLGIGVAFEPIYQLQLEKDSAGKPSSNTWTITSDARLKENVSEANYDTCYDVIKNLPLKRYTWKTEAYSSQQVADRSKLGWIAQDVEAVFPRAVTTNVFSGSGDFYIEDCKSMNADQIYAAMYGTVKKLIQTNETLQERVTTLESELQAIKTHLGL